MSSILESIISRLIFSIVVLVVSLIEIYLIIRASFLSRIKEVGVLRAIGLKRTDIYKMFSGEILGITLLASIPGYALMLYIIYHVSNISWFNGLLIINGWVILISFALIFGFNMIFGLLPVFRVVRETPARILARTDIE